VNRLSFFGTPLNYRLTRAEYFVTFALSAVLFVVHIQAIRWGPALLLFAYIDVIGYLPGLFVHWRCRGDVPRVFYVLYNVMHSWITAGLVIAAWAWLVHPEWALLAVPIHLFGDRGLLGNYFKPFSEPFEPPHGTEAAADRQSVPLPARAEPLS
jgi:hypothetical protein